MKKKLFSVVTLVLLVAVLGVVLCGCSASNVQKNLEDRDYVVVSVEKDKLSDYINTEEFTIDWVVIGKSTKSLLDTVTVFQFTKAQDAIDFAKEKEDAGETKNVKQVGKTVFIGTEQAIKDAQGL